jgi:hypothetical protein
MKIFANGMGGVRTMLLAAAVLLPASSWGAVILGNLPQNNDNGETSIPSSGIIKAFSFTIPTGQAYQLDNVILRLTDYASNDVPSVQIRNDVGGTDPGSTVLATLLNPVGLGAGTFNYQFTPSSTFIFQGGTKYWLWVSTITNGFLFERNDPSLTPTGIATFNGARFSNNTGSSYVGVGGSINSFQINGTAVPEPSVLLLSGFGLAGLMVMKRRK